MVFYLHQERTEKQFKKEEKKFQEKTFVVHISKMTIRIL